MLNRMNITFILLSRFHIIFSQLFNHRHQEQPLLHNMFTINFVNKLAQQIKNTLESSLLLLKSFFEPVEYEPALSKEIEIEEDSSPLSSSSDNTNKRKYLQYSIEIMPSCTNKRRRFASSPADSAQIVIISSLSSNTFNHKKRKSVDLSSNTFESSKRRCMASRAEDFIPENAPTSLSLPSTKVSRKRKVPCGNDEISSSSKRHCMDSSFSDSFCDIMVVYTDDSLFLSKYNFKSSSSIDTLPTMCSDGEDSSATEDYFPIPSFIDVETINSVDIRTALTLCHF